jgi:uncharacterized RDD family membrane protein YckC
VSDAIPPDDQRSQGQQPPPPPPPPPPGAYGGPTAGPTGAAGAWQGPPLAEWPKRVGAFLIDNVAAFVAVFIVASILGAISDVLGALVFVLGYLAALGFALYNAYLGGETGQSIGKQQLGLRLARQDNGENIGGGLGIGRYFLHAAWGLLCGIGSLVNLAWPLFDPLKQTLTDKVLKTVVVEHPAPRS